MAKTIGSEMILLVSNNTSILEATRMAIANEEMLKLIDRELTLKDLFQVIAETQPDVILVDFEFDPHPYELLDKIASENPLCAVVAILSESGMGNSDRVVLSGARAFIQYPYRADNLVTTIKRVLELMQRNQAYSSEISDLDTTVKPRNTITVFSPKGGVGTTTIATNLAISLHKTLKEDVLLIDGKHLFGHVALYLNLRSGNSITDLIAHACMLDQTLMKQVVVKHISGIFVLPSPYSITEAQGIRPDNLFNVIQSLQQVFPYIIIDGGSNLNDNTVTYMDSSDKILLVLSSDLASMRDARQFLEISASLSYPKDKTLLILNQTGRKEDVKSEEIENILKVKIFGKNPTDESLALSSVNEGVPILLKKPHHPISKSFLDIAKELSKILKTAETKDLKNDKSEKTEPSKRASKKG
jgi:pilus assembly protein CpaE